MSLVTHSEHREFSDLTGLISKIISEVFQKADKINPLYTIDAEKHSLAISEDPDEMPHFNRVYTIC